MIIFLIGKSNKREFYSEVIAETCKDQNTIKEVVNDASEKEEASKVVKL